MTLTLSPFGTMNVFAGWTIRHAGPVALRSATHLERVEWHNDMLGHVTMNVGMGSYLQGPGAGHVVVRMSLQAEDETPFYFHYISVGEMDSHIRGETPVILTGQIEIDPAHKMYSCLNHIQLVGKGILSHDPLCQSYEMAILRG